MRLRLRPLTFAILLAGTAGSANAADLLEAYEMARQSDPVLSASESRSLATGEGVVQSRAALLPQLDGSVSWSRTETDSTGSQAFGAVVQPPSESSSENTSRGWSVNLRQSLYDHGNYTRLSAAKARAAQSEAEYKAAQDALIVRVADAYFNVLTAIETLASSRAEERSVKRQLDQAEKRLEVGLAPITDVHEARARYDTARANTIAAANSLDDAREALAEITGTPIDAMQGLPALAFSLVASGLCDFTYACAFARRLVDAYGAHLPGMPSEFDRQFPAPDVLADAPLESIGLPRTRAATLRALAHACAAGELDFNAGQQLHEFAVDIVHRRQAEYVFLFQFECGHRASLP